jgi:hypothetical protein
MVHRQVKGFHYHTVCDHVLTRKHWQVPFTGISSRQRQNFIHYDTTLLPRYYTVLSKETLSMTFIGSPGTLLVTIPFSLGPSVHGVVYITSAHTVRLTTPAPLDPRAVK